MSGEIMRSHRPGRIALKLLAALFALTTLIMGGDLVLRSFGASTIACHTVSQGGDLQPTPGCQASGSSAVVLYLPGVVARAAEASAPVIGSWLEVGDVQLVDYLGDRFDPRAAAKSVAQILVWDAQHYDRVHIYAESLGCFVAADALAEASRLGARFGDRLRLILGDCPSGARTMKPDSSSAEILYAGPIAEAIADGYAGVRNWLIGAHGPDGAVYWSWSSTNTPAAAFEEGVDVLSTQANQRRNSAGFSLAAFTDQVRYMRHGIPSLAPLAGASVSYLMVQPEMDGTVAQPQAMLDWLSTGTQYGLQIEPVALSFPSGHVDYWAWPMAWNNTFRNNLHRH